MSKLFNPFSVVILRRMNNINVLVALVMIALPSVLRSDTTKDESYVSSAPPSKVRVRRTGEPAENEVLTAMRKATDFMVNTVSYNGGYVWTYNADLTKQWGEAPARRTQIWCQEGTPMMGMMFLDV